MRSMAYSNTAKPKRSVCPKCNKKGIGVWHTIETFRDRCCRYCNYTQFQTFDMGRGDDGLYRGTWTQTESDTDRMEGYNGGTYGDIK